MTAPAIKFSFEVKMTERVTLFAVFNALEIVGVLFEKNCSINDFMHRRREKQSKGSSSFFA